MEYLGLELPRSDRWLPARALVLANARYWSTIAPIVHTQLCRWERHARAIPDQLLRTIAVGKLREERFNAEVAATTATLAPRMYRPQAVEAIVAFEVMYDYLDGLTEQPTKDPLSSGHQLFCAFTCALNPRAELTADYYRYCPNVDDGGYLRELARVVQVAVSQLPAIDTIADVTRASAARCARAQVRVHAAPRVGINQLEQWSKRGAVGTGLEWRAWLAGAVASVLAVHALIAAAADQHTTIEQATQIDATYLCISALSTILDSVIDYKTDVETGVPWYLQHYVDRSYLSRQLTDVTRHAMTLASRLPNSAHHVMTLVGVVTYYTSAPSATDELARPLVTHIHNELRPHITPTLAVMRAWRIAKRISRSSRNIQPCSENRVA